MSSFQDFEDFFDQQITPAIQQEFARTGTPLVQIVSGVLFHLAAELHLQGSDDALIRMIAQAGIEEGRVMSGGAAA